MDRKVLNLSDVVFKADETTGIVEGIANVGNVIDLQGDNMLPGCWSKVIAEGQEPFVCWNHNLNDIRGKVLHLQELPPGDQRIPLNRGAKGGSNATGLLFKAQMALKTQAGHDLFELFKGGYVKDVSVQFANKKEDEEITRDGIRNIKMVHTLFEISGVPRAASTGSQVLLTKALDGVKAGETDWQAIHDLACTNKASCSLVALETETSQPAETTAEATAPNVTELTAYALAFARAYGTVVGDQI